MPTIEAGPGMVEQLFAELRKVFEGPVTQAPAPDGDGVLVGVRHGFTVTKHEGPRREARRHLFTDVRSFAEWLNRHVKPEVRERCEILSGVDHQKANPSVEADLNPADPDSDRVTLLLAYHPYFEMWRRVFDVALDQKAFHRLLRGVLPTFPAPDGVSRGELLANAVRSTSVVTAGDATAEIDETGYWRVSADSRRQTITSTIPPVFEVSMPIFDSVYDVVEPDETELRTYKLELLLSLEVTEGAGVRFEVTCPTLPIVFHQAMTDAVAYLRDLLDPGFLVGLGKLGGVRVPKIS